MILIIIIIIIIFKKSQPMVLWFWNIQKIRVNGY
jgi:hypothetical protein